MKKENFIWIAGPCAVESYEQCLRIALELKKSGCHIFRGGAYKPRTSPGSFQGLEQEGLDILARVKKEAGMKICTEVVDIETLPGVLEVADILQIGSRNMHNYSLLKAIGKTNKTILLKRGYAANLKEFLGAAEYITQGGNKDIILCERGIRTFGDHCRYHLDLQAVIALKKMTDFPVIVDPSHAAGETEAVKMLARAALAINPDGMIIEVHDKPEEALCDAQQAIHPDDYKKIVDFWKLIN